MKVIELNKIVGEIQASIEKVAWDMIREKVAKGNVIVGYGYKLDGSEAYVTIFPVHKENFQRQVELKGLTEARSKFMKSANECFVAYAELTPVWIYVDEDILADLDRKLIGEQENK